MQVFLINGNPRAGKDTFVDMVRDELRPLSGAFSYIDPVKDTLAELKLDVTAKTEQDRLLLAELGTSLERHSSYLSRRCVAFALARRGMAVFLYVREGGPMRTIEAMLHDADPEIVVRRVLVVRPDAPVLRSNRADSGVNLIGYDIEVHNDGTLDDLETLAEHFADLVRKGVLPKKPGPAKPRLQSMKLYASSASSTELELEQAA